jgi:flagellum-specific ATP synthase
VTDVATLTPLGLFYGKLVRVTGPTLEIVGCRLTVGQYVEVDTEQGQTCLAQVVGFNRDIAYAIPLTQAQGFFSGARVLPQTQTLSINVGPELLGRVLDGVMVPLDDLPAPQSSDSVLLQSMPLNPLHRQAVTESLDVGIRAINAVLTPGKGQRLGLFAGSGVGKSVLLGMMTRFTKAEVVIVGLIGERGREVKEFIEHSLGEQGRRKAVVIAAPADTSPLMRMRAAETCHCLAQYYRDQGLDVLLLMDSLSRYAQAQREVALSVGEPPATKGYPPSVFSHLTQLVERAGNGLNAAGSLTAFYTVLVEGDDQQDPIADAARAILDGHIVLSRELAEQGHYPAIDIGASVSRVMPQVVDKTQLRLATRLRQLYGKYHQVRELLPLGGYQPGADPEMDLAVNLYPKIEAFLRQEVDELSDTSQSTASLERLLAGSDISA